MKKIIRSVILSLSLMVVLLAAGTFFLSSATKVSGQQSRGWRVWVKTSPCSGRFDWLTVAKETPPPQGGGLSDYVPYETLLGRAPAGMMDCLDSSERGCTFAQAEQLREALRFNSKFSNYCCRDYSVWKDTQTGKAYVALVRTGTPGLGQQFVKGNLCCEEAEALAGTPGVCSGRKASGSGWGTYQNGSVNQGDGTTLTYYRGTTAEQCRADCDKNPGCAAFTFIKAGAFGPNDPAMCYLMSEVKKVTPSSCCVTAIKNESDGGSRSARNTNRNRTTPTRPQVEALPADADEPVAKTSTPPARPPVTKIPTPTSAGGTCTASDQALWAKISGTWQAKYGYVTFSGSCENITGFWMQGTWSHPLRKDGTDQRGEISDGKMSGGSLTFRFFQPWGDQRKGSDSCYPSDDGKKLNCRYLESLWR